MTFDETKYGYQGDAEAPNLLRRLAKRFPQHTFVVVGKNNGGGNLGCENIVNPYDTMYDGVTFNTWSEGGRVPEGATLVTYPVSGHTTGWYAKPEGVERDLAIATAISQLDGMIVHMGNMGTVHSTGVPASKTTWAQCDADPELFVKPFVWPMNYGGYLLKGLNLLGDRTDGKAPVVWICADPRNYMKARDLKWPTGLNGVLAQYNMKRTSQHERFRDPRSPRELGFSSWCVPGRNGELWTAHDQYEHADLELMILPDDWLFWGNRSFFERLPIGIATTSFKVSKPRRSELVRDWILKEFPDAGVWGKWDAESLADVPEGTVEENEPAQFQDILQMYRVTLALPVLGGGWTAAKPYQCFAARVACFMMEGLDDQGWVMPTTKWFSGSKQIAPGLYSAREDWTEDDIVLARYLRVKTPQEFVERARRFSSDVGDWATVTDLQRALLRRRWDDAGLERTIGARLSL
jgi:hypothetical protein